MSTPGKSKELKIITRPALTINDIVNDSRKIALLHIVKSFGEITEKALYHLVKDVQEGEKIELGYNFFEIAGILSSKELKEDLIALLYLGLLETNPRNKKLRITADGLDFLEQNIGKLGDNAEKIAEAVENLKPKIIPIDAEQELTFKLMRPGRRRRRRGF